MHRQGYLRANPLEGVQGTGKRRHGKPQLRIDQARKWQAKALAFADEGEAGAGHESVTTTLQSYAKAGAGAGARQERVLTMLAGGKQNEESAA